MTALQKQQALSAKDEAEKKKAQEKEQKKKQLLAEKKKKEEAAKKILEKEEAKKTKPSFAEAAVAGMNKKGDDDEVLELTEDGEFDVDAIPSLPPVQKAPKLDEDAAKALAEAPLSSEEADMKEKEEEEDKTPPPEGNGGSVDGKYVWTQTLSELTVNVPVPPGTKAKQLDVTFTNTQIKVCRTSFIHIKGI
jgi:hypothetical protein